MKGLIRTLVVILCMTLCSVPEMVLADSAVPPEENVMNETNLNALVLEEANVAQEKRFARKIYVVNEILYLENTVVTEQTKWVEVPWETKRNMCLVNKVFPLKSPMKPPMDGKCGVLLETECSKALKNMQAECQNATGKWPSAISGYRTYGYQSNLFNRYLRTNRGDWQRVNGFAALPGQSEHHTGLAVDLGIDNISFCNTPQYAWLKDNCQRYGFIERYANGKTGITGYIWEPWHYRYVGTLFSEYMYSNHLTLEEFYQRVREQGRIQIGSKYIQLVTPFYYVTATQSATVEVYDVNTGEYLVVTDF